MRQQRNRSRWGYDGRIPVFSGEFFILVYFPEILHDPGAGALNLYLRPNWLRADAGQGLPVRVDFLLFRQIYNALLNRKVSAKLLQRPLGLAGMGGNFYLTIVFRRYIQLLILFFAGLGG